jgi:hypothetical protein
MQTQICSECGETFIESGKPKQESAILFCEKCQNQYVPKSKKGDSLTDEDFDTLVSAIIEVQDAELEGGILSDEKIEEILQTMEQKKNLN